MTRAARNGDARVTLVARRGFRLGSVGRLAPGFWLSFGAVGVLLYAGSNRIRAPPARSLRERAAEWLRDASHALVYDTGPRFTDAINAGGHILVPFLRAAGISQLDALIVSHADSDNSGGALSILRALPVQRMLSSLPLDHPIIAANALAALRALQRGRTLELGRR